MNLFLFFSILLTGILFNFMGQTIIFYLFSALAVISALGVILQTRPTRSLLCLIVTMACLAVLFILLGAYFVAMVHLIVYAGAVLVLFLFVIMLQGVGAKSLPLRERFKGSYLFAAVFTGFLFLWFLLSLVCRSVFNPSTGINGSVENIGMALFQNYLLPFELASILLLLGIFAAVSLAKEDPRES